MSALPSHFGRLASPEGLVLFFQSRGPVFIKIAQYLALRPDLLSQELCDRLATLQDKVDTFPWNEAKAALTRELGRDPAEVFRFIDPKAVGSGSLAQVHRAQLHDGRIVAVKIQRPDIQREVRVGLRKALNWGRILKTGRKLGVYRLTRLAKLLDWVRELSALFEVVDPKDFVSEVESWLEQELDFERELANLKRLQGFLSGSQTVQAPKPIAALCSSKVLVVEFLKGIPLSQLVGKTAVKRQEARKYGIDRKQLAGTLMQTSLEQVFRNQFFHADLHPGNLMALPDNKLGLIDFGLCSSLDETVRDSQLRYMTALYNEDNEAIFRALTEILDQTEDSDQEGFHRDFIAESRGFSSSRDDNTSPLTERTPFARYLIALLRAAKKNHYRVPPGILSLYRMALQVEAVADQLGAGESLRDVAIRFFGRFQIEQILVQSADLRQLGPVLLNVLNFTRDSPRQLNEVLTQIADGTYNWNVYTNEASRTQRSRNERTQLLTVALASVGVSFLLTVPWIQGAAQAILVGVAIFLYASVALLWWRLK